MIWGTPLVFLSSCQDIMSPMAYLLGFTKTWTCNCLRVTCVDDRDRNDLCYEFHSIVRWHQKDVTRGSTDKLQAVRRGNKTFKNCFFFFKSQLQNRLSVRSSLV